MLAHNMVAVPINPTRLSQLRKCENRCGYCFKSFRRKSELKRHLKAENGSGVACSLYTYHEESVSLREAWRCQLEPKGKDSIDA